MRGKARRTDMALLDCGLSKTGVYQAKDLHNHLHELLPQEVDLVVTSALTRTVQTTSIIFKDGFGDVRR